MKIFVRYLIISLLVTAFTSCTQVHFKKLEPVGNKYNLSTELLLMNKEFVHKIDSLYESGTEGYFIGANNVKIYYKYFCQSDIEKGAIVISAGRTEAAVKYKEVIFDLFNNGYSVYIHDHRGQGLSDRMLTNHDMGYVEEFKYYIDDMKYFYNHFVVPHNHKNIYLLTHSMGGAIGATYLQEYSNDFTAAAFSSPMLGFSFPSCLIVDLLTGEEPEYAPGHHDYNETIDNFEGNYYTGSKVRYTRMIQVFDEVPAARLGGATYQWVEKSCNQFDVIFDNISNIKTPLILFSAENEEIVATSAHEHFIKELNAKEKVAVAYYVEDAHHELLIEKDEIRIAVLTEILDFYEGYEN